VDQRPFVALLIAEDPGAFRRWRPVLWAIAVVTTGRLATQLQAGTAVTGGYVNSLDPAGVTYPNPLGIFPRHGWFSHLVAANLILAAVTAVLVVASPRSPSTPTRATEHPVVTQRHALEYQAPGGRQGRQLLRLDANPGVDGKTSSPSPAPPKAAGSPAASTPAAARSAHGESRPASTSPADPERTTPAAPSTSISSRYASTANSVPNTFAADASARGQANVTIIERLQRSAGGRAGRRVRAGPGG
jgi:hypothetical protein